MILNEIELRSFFFSIIISHLYYIKWTWGIEAKALKKENMFQNHTKNYLLRSARTLHLSIDV